MKSTKYIGELKLLGERVRAARQFAGLSQVQLSKKLGYKTYQSVQNWEYGHARPNETILRQIAKITQISSEWLIKGRTNQYQEGSQSEVVPVEYDYDLGERIRFCRYPMTRGEFAVKTNIDESKLKQWEDGEFEIVGDEDEPFEKELDVMASIAQVSELWLGIGIGPVLREDYEGRIDKHDPRLKKGLREFLSDDKKLIEMNVDHSDILALALLILPDGYEPTVEEYQDFCEAIKANNNIGLIISRCRIFSGLTREQLADNSGIDVNLLKQWETSGFISDKFLLNIILDVFNFDPIMWQFKDMRELYQFGQDPSRYNLWEQVEKEDLPLTLKEYYEDEETKLMDRPGFHEMRVLRMVQFENGQYPSKKGYRALLKELRRIEQMDKNE